MCNGTVREIKIQHENNVLTPSNAMSIGSALKKETLFTVNLHFQS
jgi:hypothetical protein